mmetsp:Transcript_103217/g.315839  ORF Transcript_103217/g.315839 Transcript_103217/m.315839 type:complete len:221 (+) Transcript_103217:182-844(+)
MVRPRGDGGQQTLLHGRPCGAHHIALASQMRCGLLQIGIALVELVLQSLLPDATLPLRGPHSRGLLAGNFLGPGAGAGPELTHLPLRFRQLPPQRLGASALGGELRPQLLRDCRGRRVLLRLHGSADAVPARRLPLRTFGVPLRPLGLPSGRLVARVRQGDGEALARRRVRSLQNLDARLGALEAPLSLGRRSVCHRLCVRINSWCPGWRYIVVLEGGAT